MQAHLNKDIPFFLKKMLVATRNGGKVREFQYFLGSAGIEVLGLADLSITKDFEENGTTFAENARLKALRYSLEAPLPVLADDSGLEVAALDGRPGIYSARYAGEGAGDSDRIEKLLWEMRNHPGSREARFVCALALAQNGRLLLEAEGECRGLVSEHPRGSNGFGYDPIFLFPELGRTYAELTEDEKNRYSHRSNATHALLGKLGSIGKHKLPST
jgi:XTP/dITP diphosphohydrolase